MLVYRNYDRLVAAQLTTAARSYPMKDTSHRGILPCRNVAILLFSSSLGKMFFGERKGGGKEGRSMEQFFIFLICHFTILVELSVLFLFFPSNFDDNNNDSRNLKVLQFLKEGWILVRSFYFSNIIQLCVCIIVDIVRKLIIVIASKK